MLIKKVRFGTLGVMPASANSRLLGCCRPQAPRAQPQGSRLQVPPDSHRVPYPPSVPLLQDRRCPSTNLEIRVCHRLHHGLVDYFYRLFGEELEQGLLGRDSESRQGRKDSSGADELKKIHHPKSKEDLSIHIFMNVIKVKCHRFEQCNMRMVLD